MFLFLLLFIYISLSHFPLLLFLCLLTLDETMITMDTMKDEVSTTPIPRQQTSVPLSSPEMLLAYQQSPNVFKKASLFLPLSLPPSLCLSLFHSHYLSLNLSLCLAYFCLHSQRPPLQSSHLPLSHPCHLLSHRS